MSRGRRIAAWTGIAVLVVSLLGALAWTWWIPAAVEDRVRAAAARRGLDAEIGGLDLGLGAVVLRSVRLRGGRSLVVDVDRLDTGAGVLELASEGTAAIRILRLHGVHVTLDTSADDLGQVVAALRGSEAGTDTPSRGGRLVELQEIAISINDDRGALLRLDGGEVSLLPEGILRVGFDAGELAPGADDGLSFGRIAGRLERDDERGWQIADARAAEVAVRYREREEGARAPLRARLSTALDALRAALPSDAEATLPDEEPEGTQGEEDAEAELEAAGLRALFDAGRARLAEGARLSVSGLSVRAQGEGGERRVLRELEAELVVLPRDRYRVEGSGRPGRGGRLGWDLTLDPDALRAEGELDFQRLPFVLLAPFLPRLPWHDAEETRLSGALTIRGESATRIQLEGNVSIDDLALASPRIAPQPVERIALSLSGRADWIPADRRLEVEQATLGLGQARVTLTGAFEWPEDHFLVDARATLPPTDCDVAIGAIPEDLLAELAGFTFTGRIGGQVVLHVDSRELDATRLRVHVANGCVFDTAPAIADVRRFEGPFTHRVLEPDGGAFEMETGPGTLEWTPITRISPYFVQAVLGHEDAGFYQHAGFSVSSIERALVRNLQEGRYVYGASTITMQLVKNVFLHREKTLARKVQEVILTWWLESVMEKDQILELYLNVIEYGPSIYGIRAAAMHYFGRIPAELGPAESAYLATILPNPKAFHEHWEEGEMSDRHRRRVERFVNTLESRGRYDATAAALARERVASLRFHRPGDPLPPSPFPPPDETGQDMAFEP